MRAFWISLGLLLIGGTACWVLREGDAPMAARQGATVQTSPDAPALRGADVAKQAARLAKEEAQRSKAALRAWETREGKHATVIGRILDAQGHPIQQAEIGVLQGNDGSELGATQEDGRFDVVFEVEGEGIVRLIASAPGYVPKVLPWQQIAKQTVTDLGTLRLEPGLRIEGRVVDQHGEPFDKAGVEIWPDDDPEPTWWYAAANASDCFDDRPDTDEQGHFLIAGLPPGRYRLRIDDNDSVEAVILEGQEAGAAPLAIVLERNVEEPAEGPSWTVQIHVTGAPWERTDRDWKDHRIQLAVIGPWRTHRNEQVGAELTAHFEGPDPVSFMLSLPNTAHPPIVVADVRPPGGRIEVRLPPPTYLRGRIVAPPGTALSGFLTLHANLSPSGVLDARMFEHDPASRGFARSAVVDAEGRFEFRAVLPGQGELHLVSDALELEPDSHVVRTDGGPITVKAFANLRADVRFVLPPRAKVKEIRWDLYAIEDGGRAWLQEGTTKPPSGATVHLIRSAVAHVLVARTVGHPVLGPVEILMPRGSSDVTVTFPPPRILTGQVVDEDGRPIPQAWVELARDTPRSATWPVLDGSPAELGTDDAEPTLTELDGSFRLAVPPEGRWHLVVNVTGHAIRGGPLLIRPATKTVRVVMEPALRITGRLTHADHEVPGGYTVTAWPQDGGEGLSCGCDSYGYFQLRSVPAGRYTLVAQIQQDLVDEVDDSDTHYQALKRDVRAGTRSLVIPLRNGVAATLDLRDANGKPLPGAGVFISGAFIHRRLFAATTQRTFTARGLPPGPHRFEIDVYGKGHHTVEAKPGKTVRYIVR